MESSCSCPSCSRQAASYQLNDVLLAHPRHWSVDFLSSVLLEAAQLVCHQSSLQGTGESDQDSSSFAPLPPA